MKVTVAVGEISNCAFPATIYYKDFLTYKYKTIRSYKDNGFSAESYVKIHVNKILKSLEGKATSVAIECPFLPHSCILYGERLAKRYVSEWIVDVLTTFQESCFDEIALICQEEDLKQLTTLVREKLTCQLNV